MQTERGIDVTSHWHLIEAVVHGHFRRACRSSGLDLEDLRQMVVVKLLQLNAGRAPFDPGRCRSSPTGQVYGYVLMVAHGVFARWAKTHNYRRRRSAEMEPRRGGVADTGELQAWLVGQSTTEWWRQAAAAGPS